MPIKKRLKGWGSTRNLLVFVGLLCESIWLFVAVVTPAPENVDFGSETIAALQESLPQSAIRDEAVCIIRSQTDTIKGNFRAKRKMGNLVGSIGFVIFVIAWKAHIENRRSASAPRRSDGDAAERKDSTA